MVLILDGNSEIGVHARSNLRYLVCLKQLVKIGSRHKLNIFPPQRPICLHAGFTYSELPSNISTMTKMVVGCRLNPAVEKLPFLGVEHSIYLLLDSINLWRGASN